ncbi:MAG: branched-chain amino acid ABC transporter permease [Limnochordia bacterium]|nr:branched-chain amino acid ABC transporter permease [Bacillota bacterium]NLL07518.1 branched-chain amino acid ABC transporter permease [Bacillota bacterium]
MANKLSGLLKVALLVLVYAAVQFLEGRGILLPYHVQILSLCCINIILVVSLNLINGFTGQFSIGHAGFFAIGAYLSAYLTVKLQLPFIPAIICGGILAGLTGLAVGLPALRLRGDYLAIATLGFGEIIRVIILNTDAVGGARGFSGIPKYTTFGLAYLTAIITVVVIRNFVASDYGRACLAVREDEIAAESLGVNSTYFKVLAFALGAFFAGAAGALFSHYLQYMAPTPSQIGFVKSIDILIMLVLGGLGSITGSVVAAIVLTVIPEFLRGFAEYRMILYPILLMAVMIYRPSGLMAGRELTLKGLTELFKGAKTRAYHS